MADTFAYTTAGNTERLLAQTYANTYAPFWNEQAQLQWEEAQRQYEYRKQYDPNTPAPSVPVPLSTNADAWYSAIVSNTG